MTQTNQRLALIGALLALILCLCAMPSHAEEVSIFSAKRLALGAQIGAQWQRDTNVETGWMSKPAVKLVPVYRLWGDPLKAKGSVALVFPAELTLTDEKQARFGVFLSVVLFDGSDPE